MNGFGKKLNESFNIYFKKLNESNFEEFDNMTKEPILEFPNGEYFYVDVDKENNLMFAGSATNNGIIREFEIEYDFDDTLDGNLSRLYDTIIEERPELLDELNESLKNESIIINTEYGNYEFLGKVNIDGETLFKFKPLDEEAIETSKDIAEDNGEEFDGYAYMTNEEVYWTLSDNDYDDDFIDSILDESYDKKQLIAAVKDAYGLTTKEANNWIKNADEASKEEIVKGFKSNSARSFLTDSLEEDLDKYQRHPDRYNIKLSKLKDTVEDYFKTTNGNATIILNGEYYNIINESSNESYLKEANKYDSKMENEIRKTMKNYGVDDEDIDKAVKDNKHRRRMTNNEVSDNGQRANIDRNISDLGHVYKTPAEKALLKHDRHDSLTHVGPNNEFKINSSSFDRLADTFVKLKNDLK